MHINYNDVIGMIYCDADAIIHLKLCACVARLLVMMLLLARHSLLHFHLRNREQFQCHGFCLESVILS